MKPNTIFCLLAAPLVTGQADAQTFTRIDTSIICTIGGESQSGSWGDFNNDGHPDVFIANGGRNAAQKRNFLFLNNGNWRFTQVTSGDIVNFTSTYGSGGSCWGDYDNDGRLDILVSFFTNVNNQLYRNNGDSTFTRVTTGAIVNDGGDSNAPSWVDYDKDGDLDLYCNNDARQKNFLYRNDGNGSFTKITEGDIVNYVAQNTLGANWADFDNDGDMDVFVANYANNRLYMNNGDGTFTTITTGHIVNDGEFSLNSAWGDYDNDGNLDLFVPSRYGADFLYRGNGDTTFQRITTGPIVSQPGSLGNGVWGDFDNDGDLDLYISRWFGNGRFFRNDGGGTFTQITSGIFVNESGGGASVVDINRDGFLDIFVARGAVSAPYTNVIYANDGNGNSWINIKCVGTVSNKTAIGTRVRAKATINGTPVWQLQEIAQGNAYNGHNSLEVHFGFGNATMIDSLVIRWPSGTVEQFTNVVVNNHYTAAEGQGIVVHVGSPLAGETPSAFALYQNYPNPFNPSTTISFKLRAARFTSLNIYDLLGRKVATLVNEKLGPGSYEVTWDASGFSSGTYFYRLQTGDFVETRKLLLLR